MAPSESYEQSDPRLKPPHPNSYPWYGLPAPSSPEAVVKVFMIPTTSMTGPKDMLTAFSRSGDTETLPSFSFLIEHEDYALLWDLGLREDPENSTKSVKENDLPLFQPHPAIGVIKQLETEGYDTAKIRMVVLSHRHFDRDFDTLPPATSDIVVGNGTLEAVGKGAPVDETSSWPSSWLKKHHIVELPSPDAQWTGEAGSLSKGSKTRKWEKVGCFDHAVDWFGDGSLWFVDTPGHAEGHLMALARVTAEPPSYVLLSGDAAHHQTQYLPVPNDDGDKRSPIPVIDGKPQLATDPPVLAHTIGGMTRMSREEDVMVLMAHEKEALGVLAEFPEPLNGWKSKGWKQAKEASASQ